jgi:hypothetical protein
MPLCQRPGVLSFSDVMSFGDGNLTGVLQWSKPLCLQQPASRLLCGQGV